MARALVLSRQPPEISESEIEMVLADRNPAFQSFQAGEQAAPRSAAHRLPWSPAAASDAETRASTSSFSMALAAWRG
jgi:hypothetical protein